jgi:opacity protein-like surface antigen
MESTLSKKNKSTHGVGYSRSIALAALGGLVAISSSAVAGDASKTVAPVETSSIWEKPAWLTDLSLRVGESYDTNAYLGGIAVAPGDNVATKNKATAVTTISPKIGVDFAKLLDKDSIWKVLSLGYSPDFVIFHDASSETYSSHRFTTAIKAKADNVTFNLENAFTYIDGDKDGLFYPGGASAYANGTIRERRNQWQERTKASVKIDLNESFFFRPTASLLYYDLGTNFLPATTLPGGYTNFIDRYDLNGGADFGYNVNKDVAFTVGYRYGHQYQANLPLNVDPTQTNASSDYQRVLFGVEGSPLKWLKVEASVGPQFTSYTDSRPTESDGTIKVRTYSVKNGKIVEKVKVVATTDQIDQDPTDVYAEASVTISPTATDALVLKYKRWDWVSSTGKNAYLDTLYDASFRHQITKQLELAVGVRASNSDYNPSSLRNDWLYTTSVGLKYAVTKNLGLDLTYSYDRGSNDQLLGNAVTGANVDPSTRQFERSIVSTGVTWKF